MNAVNRIDRHDRYDPTTRKTAIFVGLMFLTATGTFAAGDGAIRSAFATADPAPMGQLALGVALISACGIAVVAVGAAMLNILRRVHTGMAWGYLVFRALECAAIVALGGYMLAAEQLVNYQPAVYVFTGVSGLIFSYLLYRGQLVPAWLAQLGLVGYVAILAVVPADLLGIATLDSASGMLFYIPGGVFEFVLPILLMARGFRRPASQPAASVRPAQIAA